LSVTSNFGAKPAHQPKRRPAVAAPLYQHVEDLAITRGGAC
jgi:hypothetical protein